LLLSNKLLCFWLYVYVNIYTIYTLYYCRGLLHSVRVPSKVNSKLTYEQILNISFLVKDGGIAITTHFIQETLVYTGVHSEECPRKFFKTLIPRNQCVQVICTQPRNCFIWNYTNSELCRNERAFPQYDFVTVLWKNTKWWSRFVANLFYRRDYLNGHVILKLIILVGGLG
jgi:hypothetical protein